jgi:hypothetical protein
MLLFYDSHGKGPRNIRDGRYGNPSRLSKKQILQSCVKFILVSTLEERVDGQQCNMVTKKDVVLKTGNVIFT